MKGYTKDIKDVIIDRRAYILTCCTEDDGSLPMSDEVLKNRIINATMAAAQFYAYGHQKGYGEGFDAGWEDGFQWGRD